MKLNDNHHFRPDGSNLASFLYYLREKHDSSYGMIRRTVQLVAPFFDDFILEPLALNEDAIRLEWRHRGSDSYFDAASLSDGSLRFVALATLLLQPKGTPPLGDSIGRTGTRIAPLRNHDSSLHHQTGVCGNPNCPCDTVIS